MNKKYRLRTKARCWVFLFCAILLAGCSRSQPPTPTIAASLVVPQTAAPLLLATDPPRPTALPSPTAAKVSITPTLIPSVTIAPDLPTATETLEIGVILWDDAKNHIGEELTVCGPVVEVRYAEKSKGQPTFLNIGKKYPVEGRFTAVIWGENRAKFDLAPEIAFKAQTVCVHGVIEEYQGEIEIVVEEPDQIEVKG